MVDFEIQQRVFNRDSLVEDVLDFVSPAPLHLVVLNPSAATLRARAAGRDRSGHDEAVTADLLHLTVDRDTRRVGLWLDTSDHGVAETVDLVLSRLRDARVETADLPPAVAHHD